MYFDRDMEVLVVTTTARFLTKRFFHSKCVKVTLREKLVSRSKYIEKRSPLEIILLHWSSIFAQNMSSKHSNYLEYRLLP